MPWGLSILVASGDQDLADFLCRRLTTLGCRAPHVTRTTHALDAVESGAIGAVFVADRLEDGAGRDAIRALRERRPDLAIFWLADASHAVSSHCGETRRVACPASQAELEELLEDVLDASLAPAAPAPAASPATPRPADAISNL